MMGSPEAASERRDFWTDLKVWNSMESCFAGGFVGDVESASIVS